MIKTLIVDDSDLVRSVIRDFLESDGSFEIIGEAVNGPEGVSKAQALSPDLITMDIDMPEMNGLDAIDEIKKFLNTAIVVISTHDSAKMAYDATVRGAMEFFSKDVFISHTKGQQREKILTTLKHITGIKKRIPSEHNTAQHDAITPRKIKCIVIAASTGGPMALCQLCGAIPEDFPVPIMLVQHNTSGFDKGFVQWLNGYTSLNVRLAEEGIFPEKGNIYVAPTDKHLAVSDKGIVLDDSNPVHNQKPAADIMFKSAAGVYGEELVSVVLTGMGEDGADGTRSVKQSGGITIAQDESSSMIYGMPRAAVETGCVDIELPLSEIPKRLIKISSGE